MDGPVSGIGYSDILDIDFACIYQRKQEGSGIKISDRLQFKRVFSFGSHESYGISIDTTGARYGEVV